MRLTIDSDALAYAFIEPTKEDFKDGMKELVEWGEKVEAVDKFDEAHEELKARGLVEE